MHIKTSKILLHTPKDSYYQKKLKPESPHDPTTPLLGIYPKEVKAESQRDVYNHVPNSIIHKSQRWKKPKCPLTDECIMW